MVKPRKVVVSMLIPAPSATPWRSWTAARRPSPQPDPTSQRSGSASRRGGADGKVKNMGRLRHQGKSQEVERSGHFFRRSEDESKVKDPRARTTGAWHVRPPRRPRLRSHLLTRPSTSAAPSPSPRVGPRAGRILNRLDAPLTDRTLRVGFRVGFGSVRRFRRKRPDPGDRGLEAPRREAPSGLGDEDGPRTRWVW